MNENIEIINLQHARLEAHVDEMTILTKTNDKCTLSWASTDPEAINFSFECRIDIFEYFQEQLSQIDIDKMNEIEESKDQYLDGFIFFLRVFSNSKSYRRTLVNIDDNCSEQVIALNNLCKDWCNPKWLKKISKKYKEKA